MSNLSKGWQARLVPLAGAFGLLLALPFSPPAHAADEDLGSTYARVRYIDGGLTLQRTGEGDVSPASQNSPIAPGDSAWTDGGRAEIEFADGSVVRLDDGTRVDFRNLADINNTYEKTNLIALEQGSLRIDAPDPATSDRVFQIDTDGGSVYLLSGGSFRIDAEGSVSTLSSLRGVAELSGDNGSVLVHSGERSSVRRGGGPADPRPFNTLRRDDFDRFCEERDRSFLRHDDNAPPAQLRQDLPGEVDPYVGELSVYGDWHEVPDYGWVWRPAYSGSWGPYVNGEWVWYPTGWVWVSYDPWGWAPYHYGRWDFRVDLGWFWIPGRRWSGAWVSFAVGPSHIGWCPLNFYNRPVFQSVNYFSATNVNVTRLDPRGWRFVQTSRFGAPRGDRGIIRPDRLPRGSEVVMTGSLPRFDARGIAAHPGNAARLMETVRTSRTPLPANGGADRPVPFRALERGRGENRPGAARGPALPSRPRSDRARPGPASAEPRRSMDPGRGEWNRPRPLAERPQAGQVQPAPRERPREDMRVQGPPRDRAVERLFNGIRRERPPARIEPPRLQPSAPSVRPQASRPQASRPQPAPTRATRPPRPERHH